MLEVDTIVKLIQHVEIGVHQANTTIIFIHGTVVIMHHVSVVNAGNLSKGLPVKGAISTANKGKPSH